MKKWVVSKLRWLFFRITGVSERTLREIYKDLALPMHLQERSPDETPDFIPWSNRRLALYYIGKMLDVDDVPVYWTEDDGYDPFDDDEDYREYSQDEADELEAEWLGRIHGEDREVCSDLETEGPRLGLI